MKIKVKRVRGGSMGDQRDYGLVTGSIWNYENKPTTNQVSDTVGPVDRDEATIEAERGETVVGDINNDGMLEHFIVGGKRHFQGGTPLNVPDGSFVFSDTRALNIKNKDVLKNIFGVTASKGMTPAKVAKKFDLNQYNDLLLDPEADAMSKRTAQMMLDNNIRKLGQLALVQEGMKGFPDGIPDIALPLFGTDQASSQPSQQMMRRGGLVKYQDAGSKPKYVSRKNMTPAQEAALTKKIERDAVKKALDLYWNSARNSPEKNKANKMFFNMGQLPNKYSLYDLGLEGDRGDYMMAHYPYKINPHLKYDSNTGEELDPHDQGNYLLGAMRGDPYLNPQMVNAVLNKGQSPGITRTTPVKPRKGLSTLPPKFELTTPDEGSVQRPVVEKANQIFKSAFNSDDENAILNAISQIQGLSVPFSYSTPATTIGVGFGKINPLPGGTPFRTGNRFPEGLTWQEKVNDMANVLEDRLNTIRFNKDLEKKRKESTKRGNQAQAKSQQLISKANEILANPSQATADQINTATNILKINSIRSGAAGVMPYFSGASGLLNYGQSDLDEAYNTLFGETEATQQKVSASAVSAPVDSIPGPTYASLVDSTGRVTMLDTTAPNAQQAVIRQQPTAAPKTQVPAYNPDDIDTTYKPYRLGGDLEPFQDGKTYLQYPKESQVVSTDKYSVVVPSKDYGKFPTQSYDPNLGYYTVYNQKTKAKEQLDLDDFLKRQSSVLTGYSGGVDNWKKDVLSKDQATREKATDYFQEQYNAARTKMGLSPYFFGAPNSVYGRDKKFGIYSWSAPGFMEKQAAPAPVVTPPAPPAPDTPAAKSTPGAVPTPSYGAGYYQPWSNYSNVDVMGAMMNYMDVNRGDLPTLYTYTPTQADPTFLDPARAIAQQQGAQGTEDIASRSFDPTTARANIIAAQAQSADPIANIQAKYDEANTQIANQFAQQNAATLNDAQLKNIAFRDKYQGELQTLQQQYDNALREGRYEVVEAIKRAMVDQMQRGALNVQNPNYAIGPNGQIYFKPGYNPLTGENTYASADTKGEKLLQQYMKKYDLSADKAADLIKAVSKLQTPNEARYGMSVSNPMDIIWG
jgi:hypothetical protein